MPRFGPISRRDLIRYLKKVGFDDPEPGGKHRIMQKGRVTVVVPNPHGGDIGVGLMSRILREAGISRAEWEAL